MIAEKDEFLPGMKEAMEKALGENNSSQITEIDSRLEEALQKDLL